MRVRRRTNAEFDAEHVERLRQDRRRAELVSDLVLRRHRASKANEGLVLSAEELAVLNHFDFGEYLDELLEETDAEPELDYDGECHVYFIQAGARGPIKIGRGSNPERRLQELQTGSPRPLFLLGSIVGSPQNEGLLHSRFNRWHLRGEWFRPAQELLSFIGNNAS